MEKDSASLIPRAKKKIQGFIKEEKGGLPKTKLLTIGSFLATTSLLKTIQTTATHTNSFNIQWQNQAKILETTHGHHTSHSSHSSHSSHGSHYSY